jgi:two-component system OmpR family response regulator
MVYNRKAGVMTVEGELSPAGARPSGTGRGRVVLVVDDDAGVRSFIADALIGEGYRVVEAADGQAALSAVAVAAPDLILLDVNMPGINGWDVLQQLRVTAGPHQPIVVMTGQYTGQERALGTGAQGYLAKPFDLEDLIESVDLHSRLTIENNLSERMGGGGQDEP